MRKTLLYLSLLCFIVSCSKSDAPIEDLLGSVFGVVSDMTTGDGIDNVKVTLTPGGRTTVTGSDGAFSFDKVAPGDYTISLSKEGYKPLANDIVVEDKQRFEVSLQMERNTASISVNPSVLDYGENLNTLSFTIVNKGYADLAIKVEKGDCLWVSVDPEVEIIAFEKTATIVVNIDRERLSSGENETKLIVRSTSGDGNAEIVVKAVGEYKDEASVNTLAVSDINDVSVKFNAEITNEGAPRYSSRGFVWSLSDNPTMESKMQSSDVSINSNPVYALVVKGLSPNKTYYVRAYVLQNDNYIYGNTVSFSTSMQPSEVSTAGVTNVTANSATFNGFVNKDGVPAYSEKGFCYSITNSSPTIKDSNTFVNGSGVGAFSANISGLITGKQYYVRAYVVQDGNYIYGSSVSFSTRKDVASVSTSSVTDISAGKATFNGTVLNIGDPQITERGFCYSASSSSPTISENKRIVSGTSIGDFSLSVTNLSYPQKYYVRAYVMQDGTPVYGNTVSFECTGTPASVSTRAVTKVNSTSATFNGYVDFKGDPPYTKQGFCYSSQSSMPTANDRVINRNNNINGAYAMEASDLQPGQTYYVRAYLVQYGEPVYGNVVSFNTLASASVSTSGVSDIGPADSFGTYYQATFYGNVTDVGSPNYTQRGFVYGTTSNPTTSDNIVTVSGSGTGEDYKKITNLLPYKTYHVRAFVKCSSGYVYGGDVSFTTY